MTQPTFMEYTHAIGVHCVDATIKGSVNLSSTEVYDWYVVSRVLVPKLPASKEERDSCNAKLQAAIARDGHPAITCARLRGGRECSETIKAIKEALRAKL